jgi:hypothetical protein
MAKRNRKYTYEIDITTGSGPTLNRHFRIKNENQTANYKYS